MEKIIVIRYSEIALKKGKRSWFEKLLIKNIKCALKNNLQRIDMLPGRILVKVKNVEVATRDLKKIFGIKSFSVAYSSKFSTFDDIIEKTYNIAKNWVEGKKFKVEARRVGKHNFTSYDIKVKLGEMLSNHGIVDVRNPEVVVYIEIRNDNIYLYKDIMSGPGGLPIGTEGKILSLISGGFDSPVAAWHVMKRGAKVDFLYCDLGSKEDLINTLRIIKKLSEWSCGYKNKIYIVECKPLLLSIEKKIKKELALIVFRKALYKVGERLSKKLNYLGLITGEVIGQKSSQTLENLYSSSYNISIPIYRPLLGLDKDDIIEISRKIGTYEISEKVGEPCSILSISPKSKSDPQEIEEEFSKIIDELEKLKIDTIHSNDIDRYIKEVSSKATMSKEYDANFDFIIGINIDIPYNNYIKVSTIEEAIKTIRSLGKNKKYLVICKKGASSSIVKEVLENEGYSIVSMDEKSIKQKSK